MATKQPRLRLFAGPNGSGKSTLKNVLDSRLLGVFVNADELEENIRNNHHIDFNDYKIVVDEQELKQYCQKHHILQPNGLAEDLASLRFADNRLYFDNFEPNSYHASAICNYIRDQLLLSKKSFSFETVMSHESKVEFLHQARNLGYRTYLYFVATETPDINVVRVQERVEKGGHPVPEDKIRSRYTRSIKLLYDAIGFANRAYIFDNSHEQHEPILIAEYDGDELIARVDAIPYWFVETWDRF